MQICPTVQFMRRCDKVAILDGGNLRHFGPFTPEAQAILSHFLPIPRIRKPGDSSAVKRPAPAMPEADKQASAVAPPPSTSMSMGSAAWSLVKWGHAWRLALALGLGLLAHSVRQMSDFWVRFWAADKYKCAIDPCSTCYLFLPRRPATKPTKQQIDQIVANVLPAIPKRRADGWCMHMACCQALCMLCYPEYEAVRSADAFCPSSGLTIVGL